MDATQPLARPAATRSTIALLRDEHDVIVEALRLMVRLLLVLGLAPGQIAPMLEQDPARLIGLDEGTGVGPS